MASNKPSYVYEITNDFNNTVYVGKTDDPTRRWEEHCKLALNKLYNDMRSQGIERFKMTVVEELSSQQDALDSESERIEQYVKAGRNVYNRIPSRLARIRKNKRKRVRKLIAEFRTPTTDWVSWSEKVYYSNGAKQFIIKYRIVGGKCWSTKAVPRHIQVAEEALAWAKDWIAALRRKTLAVKQSQLPEIEWKKDLDSPGQLVPPKSL